MCQSFYFNKAAGLRPEACNVIKKVTLAQAFSCKFCEISNRTIPVAVSVHYNKKTRQCRECQKFYLKNLQIKCNLQYLLAIEMFLKVKYSFDLTSIKCYIKRKRSRDWSFLGLEIGDWREFLGIGDSSFVENNQMS